MNKEKMDIDFVLTWVDGSDPVWLAEKKRFQKDSGRIVDAGVNRYRDWDNLRYWFRAVEKFAPWVHRIYFVTFGHLPSWLDTDNEKLVIVNHKDYIPKAYLPTFSSRPIDMNFHRIEDLSEHFVYFNDDMFLTAPVEEKDFFIQGLPCDTAILNTPCPGAYARRVSTEKKETITYMAGVFDMIPVNRHFNKKQTIRQHWTKWLTPKYGTKWLRTLLLMPWDGFPGLMSYHLPYSYLKSTYREVWEKNFDMLDQACRHKFREVTDVNHWVFSYWQLAQGTFAPRNPNIGRFYCLADKKEDNELIFDAVKGQKYKMLCINDSVTGDGFEDIKEQLKAAFETILPEKSAYEK